LPALKNKLLSLLPFKATMNRFYGTGVAMVTPFQADGQVDYPGLNSLINYLTEGGVEYLVSLGTTGESATLNNDEKRKVFAFTAEANNGRLPLVAGIAGNNTYEVVESIRHFDTHGYSAILSASPHYNKPTQEGIYQHYKAIAEASPLPVILYNVPSRTGSNIAAETTTRLAHDFSNIIGIKEASGNFDQLNQVIRDKPENFLVISGDDPISLPMIALGASGVISVVANALPRQFSDMIRLCLEGNFKGAQKEHFDIIDFTRMMFAEGSPAGVKTALKYLGICGDAVRLPLVQVSQGLAAKIIQETQKITAQVTLH
jgi:4-hydroxy-tetrahydrodipicolinate synthase